MNANAITALHKADWKQIVPSLLWAAHYIILRYQWRGMRAKVSSSNELTVEGMGAREFIDLAIEKLASGQRAYRADLSIEENIRRTVESDIYSFHKRTQKHPSIEFTLAQLLGGESDPVDDVSDAQAADHGPEESDLRKRQQELLAEFTKSITDDEDLTLLLFAFEEDKYKPAEIEEATGIPAARVSELKRKLRQRAAKFLMNHNQYAEIIPLKEAL